MNAGRILRLRLARHSGSRREFAPVAHFLKATQHVRHALDGFQFGPQRQGAEITELRPIVLVPGLLLRFGADLAVMRHVRGNR